MRLRPFGLASAIHASLEDGSGVPIVDQNDGEGPSLHQTCEVESSAERPTTVSRALLMASRHCSLPASFISLCHQGEAMISTIRGECAPGRRGPSQSRPNTILPSYQIAAHLTEVELRDDGQRLLSPSRPIGSRGKVGQAAQLALTSGRSLSQLHRKSRQGPGGRGLSTPARSAPPGTAPVWTRPGRPPPAVARNRFVVERGRGRVTQQITAVRIGEVHRYGLWAPALQVMSVRASVSASQSRKRSDDHPRSTRSRR